jgi:chromate transport protein ChrA
LTRAINEQKRGGHLSAGRISSYEAKLDKLHKELERIIATDFFNAPSRSAAASAYERCQKTLRATQNRKEQFAKSRSTKSAALDFARYQGQRWITRPALVTFGGAYAVLAYVTQAAAGSYGWLSHTQAIDGLALAETTPGPLIMVLQFVGFMAGWNNPQGMSPAMSGIIGALVTTYATFLPCFLFIFLGAPYIEVLRGNKSLTGALTGITASVVGVILNLALVFGAAVIWPQGLHGGIDWFAAAMSVAAFAALYRFKADVLWVVLTGGLRSD